MRREWKIELVNRTIQKILVVLIVLIHYFLVVAQEQDLEARHEEN